jgi:2-polyprenyl-6-methoxyphenol hydroxylase-like FAD-dependent oxidoreductase
LQLLDELGLLERLRQLPHATIHEFPTHFPDGTISTPPRTRLRLEHPTMQVPQARFLELLVAEARRYPTFHVATGARVEELLESDNVVHGVRYRGPDNTWHEVRSRLVIGADGRFSRIRQLAGLPLVGSAEPIDVLWLRLPYGPTDPPRPQGIYAGDVGTVVVMNRGDGYQIGWLFPKGSYQNLRSAGVEALRGRIAARVPWLADRMHHLTDWRQTSLLTVEAGRVRRWYRDGLLLIGDAAHVMSPVAGVGINYAVRDAVVASNVLGPRLAAGNQIRSKDLAHVQRKRELPTRLMQAFQRQMRPRLRPTGQMLGAPPLPVRLMMNFPPLAMLRERLIAFGGLWPEKLRPLEPRTPRLKLSTVASNVLAVFDTRYLIGFGIWPPPPLHSFLNERPNRPS